MNKRWERNDKIFITAIFSFCLVVFLAFSLKRGETDGQVVVTRDGREYGRYPLSVERTVEIADAEGTVTNVLVISGGRADMTEADCPDRLCVRQRAISRAGENIVCLPNRVVVAVERGKEAGLDGFAQ